MLISISWCISWAIVRRSISELITCVRRNSEQYVTNLTMTGNGQKWVFFQDSLTFYHKKENVPRTRTTFLPGPRLPGVTKYVICDVLVKGFLFELEFYTASASEIRASYFQRRIATEMIRRRGR